jgi:hypothetical protein
MAGEQNEEGSVGVVGASRNKVGQTGSTCQMRRREGGRLSSGRRATVTMHVTGPLATPPWPMGMEAMTCGGWGTAEGCRSGRGREDIGTLLPGCNAPPVQQSTRTSCSICGVRSNSVQLLPSSERTAPDNTGAGRSVLCSMTPSPPPELPCRRDAV